MAAPTFCRKTISEPLFDIDIIATCGISGPGLASKSLGNTPYTGTSWPHKQGHNQHQSVTIQLLSTWWRRVSVAAYAPTAALCWPNTLQHSIFDETITTCYLPITLQYKTALDDFQDSTDLCARLAAGFCTCAAGQLQGGMAEGWQQQ